MPLSDKLVQELMRHNIIGINPTPIRWQAMTADVHLGNQFFRIKHLGHGGHHISIDLGDYDGKKFQFQEPLDLFEGKLAMFPGQFVLAYSRERLFIKDGTAICGFIEGKSSLARIGLGVHITAPTIHPGFGDNDSEKDRGLPIMLELFNHSQNVIILRPDSAVGQFRFEEIQGELGSSGSNNYGKRQPGAA